MEKHCKKVIGVAIASLVALGGVVIHDVTEKPKVIVEEKLVPVEKIVEKTVEVPVEVIKTVEVVKEISVEDTEFLKLVCDRMVYDDLMECKEEVAAEDAALKVAVAELKSEIAEELEDAGIVADEKDVRLIKVYTDFEDVEVSDSDFDSDEYEFVIKAKVEDEDEDVKFEVLVTVEVEDGEAKITDVEKVE